MKTYPGISYINWKINNHKKTIAKLQNQLPAIYQELRTWKKDMPQYAAAAAQKADLMDKIRGCKKELAANQRLLKNPEVIRRNEIVLAVESIVEAMFPSFKNTPHYPCGFVGQKVEALTDTEYDYEYYAKSYGHPKKIFSIEVTVQPDWDTAVQAQGLAYLGGLLTLSAKPALRQRKAMALAKTMGIELFEASWMKQRKGYQVDMETGFIAVKRTSLGLLPHTAYHGTDPVEAVKAAQRKWENTDYQLPLEKRDVPADAVATWADANAVGACTPGVQNWCSQVGIDYTQESVPLLDVVRGYYMHPMPEAKAVILRVLRQHPVRHAA